MVKLNNNKPVKNLRRINVGNDAASRQVIIDDGRIDEANGKKTSLDNWVDDKSENPVGNGVNLTLGEKSFVARPSLLQLVPVDVALAEEISEKKT